MTQHTQFNKDVLALILKLLKPSGKFTINSSGGLLSELKENIILSGFVNVQDNTSGKFGVFFFLLPIGSFRRTFSFAHVSQIQLTDWLRANLCRTRRPHTIFQLTDLHTFALRKPIVSFGKILVDFQDFFPYDCFWENLK